MNEDVAIPGGRDARVRDLAVAVQLALEVRAGACSREQALGDHPHLRELLEPMLDDASGDAAASSPGAAAALRTVGDYRLLREIGRGGMGTVYEAEQGSLGRRVALKMLSQPLLAHERSLWRFQREARLLAQLEHPGIVRVFGAGTDGEVPWYAMELVEGASLARVLEAVRRHGLATATGATVAAAVQGASAVAAPAPSGFPDGYVATMVHLCAQVAEALAFAHAAAIVHRDIKPGNVLVRHDGSAVLSDFGIARQEGLPSMTMTGDFAGTPFYVSPEQARGAAVDHRTDVFSLGVTLYEALTLQTPFHADTTAEILQRIQHRQATEPSHLNPAVPGDLAAVVQKALEKDPARRYQSAGDLAQDLRAYLAGRPVQARRPGPLGRLRRWAWREPWKAALAATVTIAAGIVLVVSLVAAQQVLQKGEQAQRALADFNRLALGVRLRLARSEAESFWPARAERIEAMRRWLDDTARPLAAALPGLREQLAALRARALPYPPEAAAAERAAHPQAGDLVLVQREIGDLRRGLQAPSAAPPPPGTAAKLAELEAAEAALAARIAERRTYRFPLDEEQFLHDQLTLLVQDLEDFAVHADGSLAQVAALLDWTGRCAERFRADGPAWQAAVAAVAADPRFHGFALTPQPDLAPLGADPQSGLQEFVHLRSGADLATAVPARGTDGRLRRTEASGMVFVLLPGGRFRMGAQRTDPDAAGYDAGADDDERPLHEVELQPFLLGKHEVSQAQWLHLVGDTPSLYQPGKSSVPITMAHPVENVSWTRADAMLRRHGLVLPTEAQWEYACRAGRFDTRWSFGDDPSVAGRHANVADRSVQKLTNWPFEAAVDDGFVLHAPIGSFLPNAFGLHDLHGNVWEWCRDVYEQYRRAVAPGDGLREQYWLDAHAHVLRGGSFRWRLDVARSTERYGNIAGHSDLDIGVRAARCLWEGGR